MSWRRWHGFGWSQNIISSKFARYEGCKVKFAQTCKGATGHRWPIPFLVLFRRELEPENNHVMLACWALDIVQCKCWWVCKKCKNSVCETCCRRSTVQAAVAWWAYGWWHCVASISIFAVWEVELFVSNLTNHYSMVCGFSVQSSFCLQLGLKNVYNL